MTTGVGQGKNGGRGGKPYACRAFLLAVSCLFLLVSPILSRPLSAAEVDLELVLAVDVSSSVNRSEFALQMGGLASAFLNAEVTAAIGRGEHGGIAVTLIQWAGPSQQQVSIDWTLIQGGASAAAFSKRIAYTSRAFDAGGTAITPALEFAVGRILVSPHRGKRQVIDLSGDGRASQGMAATAGRDVAMAVGITVNGLAILNEEPNLMTYYETEVIGGKGAFAQPAADFEAFEYAILAKLLREIAGHWYGVERGYGVGLGYGASIWAGSG